MIELACLACRCFICCFIVLYSITIGLMQNSGCDYESLKDVEPPFGGELLPDNFTLVEQRSMWQYITQRKVVDVFASDGTSLGYFYDMQLPFIMRFGFFDAKGRVWVEARYPSFVSRFLFWRTEYTLERCDVGPDGRRGNIYDLKKDMSGTSWWCWSQCQTLFRITKRPDNGDDSEQPVRVADALFNSTLTWMGIQLRHEWFMRITNTREVKTLAFAHQHFYYGGMLGVSLLSNWTVDVMKNKKRVVPNWVTGFLATLDDIQEDGS